MVNVTASSTLFWKFAVPTFWLVFFTCITVGFIFSDVNPESVPRGAFIGLLCFTWGVGLLLFSLTLFRLKRVEMDEHFVVVSNYRKWYKYPYHNIEKIEEQDLVVAKVVRIYFKTPGHFGKRIFFLANHRKLNQFLEQHPEVSKGLMEE